MDNNNFEIQNNITSLSTQLLIDILFKQYHQQLRLDFSELTPLFEKVKQVHGEKYPELESAQKLYLKMKAHLEIHLSKEENVLFPMMQDFETGQSIIPLATFDAPTRIMADEHAQELKSIEEFQNITDHFRIPADACRSYQYLYQKLSQMMINLQEHIHIENNILFPRFQTKQKGGCCGLCGES